MIEKHVTYSVRCDDCSLAYPCRGDDPREVVEFAVAEGWEERGIDLLCPACRKARDRRAADA